MILFDTSAIYALTDSRDDEHATAILILRGVERAGQALLLHSYILLETFALLHRRHGRPTALRVNEQLAGLTTVVVDRMLHDRAVAWLRTASRARTSLVDAVSFVVMGDRGMDQAFAFDPDFEEAGFRLLREA